jgi:RHS repeat-associated protein
MSGPAGTPIRKPFVTTPPATARKRHDPNGALTKSDDGTTENVYTYDYDGYLSAFDTTGTDNDATYVYDADRRRIAKTVDSTTTKYFLAGANVIADYDGDDVLLATYVTPGLDDNVSIATGGSTYYYMKDGLGSIRNLVDANEATQNTYDYYAFGKELGSWTENVTNRYTYTAREYDEESEQYYYRARYYVGSGRFLSRDPARDDLNLYRYARNLPILLTDPSGKLTGGAGLGWSVTVVPTWKGAEILFVWDDKGNVGVLFCPMLGAGFGAAVTAGVIFHTTNANTICDLTGPSWEGGGSVTLGKIAGVPIGVGVDAIRGPNMGYVGIEVQVGPGAGILGAEAHFGKSFCKLMWQNNYPCKTCASGPCRLPDAAPFPVQQAFDTEIADMNASFRQAGRPSVDHSEPFVVIRQGIPWGSACF